VIVLGIDYGRSRTGVAVSDASGSLARPLTVVRAGGSPAGLARIAELVEETGAELVVVGLARTADGRTGAQAQATLAFAGRLRRLLPVPVELRDERLTTVIAERLGGGSDLDARAAAVILQEHLDAAEPAT
jgi:putative Holliday junction resolvase